MKKIIYSLIIILLIFPGILKAQYTGGNGDGIDSRMSHVFLPAPTVTSNSPLCVGSGDTLKFFTDCNITGAIYHWFGPDNFTSTDKNPIIINPQLANSGTYGLRVSKNGNFSDTSFIDVIVDTIPYTPSVHSGNNYICAGTVNSPYFATSANANSYVWTVVPANAGLFTGDSTTSNVVVIWNQSYSGSVAIRVQAVNNCGISEYAELAVLFNPSIGNAEIINNNENQCIGITSSNYQIHPVQYSNGYLWRINPTDAGFIGNVDDTTINITWNTSFIGTAFIKAAAYNTCDTTDFDSIQVTINPLPLALVANDTSICESSQIAIGAAATANHSYTWTAVPSDPSLAGQSNLANPIVSPLVTTKYYLTEINTLTTCSNNDSILVQVNYMPGIANLPLSHDTVCQGTLSTDFIITEVANRTGYIWQLNPAEAGTISYTSGDTSISVFWTPSFIGNAVVKVQAYNSCDTTQADSTIVAILEAPQAIVIANTSICYGSNIEIGGTANPAYTYSWIAIPNDPTLVNNIANPNVTPLLTTRYYLTASIGECSDTDSVLITVLDTLDFPAPINGPANVCQGTINSNYATSLTNATGFEWTINPTNAGTILGGGTANISMIWNTAFLGNANLSVAGYNTCDTSGITTLSISINPIPLFNLCDTCINDSLGVAVFPVIIDAGSGWDSLLWSDGVTTAQTFSVSGPSVVGCTVWLNGCSAYDSVIVYPLGIHEIMGNKGFAVYPNPADDKLYIMHQYNSGSLQYQIIDINGRIVESGTIREKITILNISQLPSGLYNLHLRNAKENSQMKFIKN